MNPPPPFGPDALQGVSQGAPLLSPSEPESGSDLLEYWRSITKRKWAIAAFTLTVTLAAGVVVHALTPVYSASTTLLVDAGKSKVSPTEDLYTSFAQTREYMQTQVELLNSRSVALKTITALQLWNEPAYDPRKAAPSPLDKLWAAVGMQPPARPHAWTDAELAEAVYPRLRAGLAIEPVPMSQLARVTFNSTDPVLAQRVSVKIAETFIENDLDSRMQMTRSASGWLQERMGGLKAKLAESEARLQSFRDRAGIIEAKGSSAGGTTRQLDDVTARLVETRLKRAETENAYNQIKDLTKLEDLAAVPAVVRNGNVSDALRQQSEAERVLSEVAQRYGYEHPKRIAAEAQVKAARDNLKRQIDTVVGSVTNEYQAAVGTEKALEATLERAKGAVASLNRKEYDLGVMEREVEANRELYNQFMLRSKEANVGGDLQSTVARIVDPATLPGAPVWPQKNQLILAALALGLFLASLAAVAIDRLDNTLHASDEVETKLRTPLLTTLPLLDRKSADRLSSARLFVDHPDTMYAESIRTARTGVLLSQLDLAQRTLLVTSSTMGEGKTTFAINLALSHAETKPTLLIDADLRRPAISQGLDLPPGLPGLSELTAGTHRVEECLVAVAGTPLMVLPSGMIPPNPLELLLSLRFKATLQQLAERFAVIVIDSPPVELVSDALVLAQHASGTIYLSKASSTPVPVTRKGLHRLRRAGAHILGVVLNQFDYRKAERFHGEYTAYGKQGGRYGKTRYGGAAYGSAYRPRTTPTGSDPVASPAEALTPAISTPASTPASPLTSAPAQAQAATPAAAPIRP